MPTSKGSRKRRRAQSVEEESDEQTSPALPVGGGPQEDIANNASRSEGPSKRLRGRVQEIDASESDGDASTAPPPTSEPISRQNSVMSSAEATTSFEPRRIIDYDQDNSSEDLASNSSESIRPFQPCLSVPPPSNAARGSIMVLVNPTFRGLDQWVYPSQGQNELVFTISTDEPIFDDPQFPHRLTVTPASHTDPVTRSNWEEYPDYSSWFSLGEDSLEGEPRALPKWYPVEERTDFPLVGSEKAFDSKGFSAALKLKGNKGTVFIANSLPVAVHRAALALIAPSYDKSLYPSGAFQITIDIRKDCNTSLMMYEAIFPFNADDFDDSQLHWEDQNGTQTQFERQRYGKDSYDEGRNAVMAAIEAFKGYAARDGATGDWGQVEGYEDLFEKMLWVSDPQEY